MRPQRSARSTPAAGAMRAVALDGAPRGGGRRRGSQILHNDDDDFLKNVNDIWMGQKRRSSDSCMSERNGLRKNRKRDKIPRGGGPCMLVQSRAEGQLRRCAACPQQRTDATTAGPGWTAPFSASRPLAVLAATH
eukprot:1550375-Pleurochrysis_carterae.AAC.2